MTKTAVHNQVLLTWPENKNRFSCARLLTSILEHSSQDLSIKCIHYLSINILLCEQEKHLLREAPLLLALGYRRIFLYGNVLQRASCDGLQRLVELLGKRTRPMQRNMFGNWCIILYNFALIVFRHAPGIPLCDPISRPLETQNTSL